MRLPVEGIAFTSLESVVGAGAAGSRGHGALQVAIGCSWGRGWRGGDVVVVQAGVLQLAPQRAV